MAFETYADLKTQVQSFLWDRPDVVVQVPTFIQLAETEARRLLRTREVSDSVPFTLASNFKSIPCDMGQIKAVKVQDGSLSDGRDLDYVAPESWSGIANSEKTGTPRFYTVINDKIMLWPVPTETLNGVIVYVGSFCPLSDTKTCNWLLKRHPDIYLAGALKWAKMWLIDDTQDWATPFYSAIQAANKDSPRVQMNTKLRADEASITMNRRGWNIRTGGFA